MATMQRDDAWLATATPEQIDEAYSAGELVGLLGRSTNPTTESEWAERIGLTPDEFAHIESPESLAKIAAYAKEHHVPVELSDAIPPSP